MDKKEMKKMEFTLAELGSITQSEVVGDPNFKVTGYADLEAAKETDISFLSKPKYSNTRYTTAMKKSSAGAIFIAPSVEAPSGKNYLLNEDPSFAFQKTIEAMRGGSLLRTYFNSIHPTAVIHETVAIGKNAAIGPYAVIDAYVSIGDDCFIGSGVYIGPHCTLGNHCVLQPHVTLREWCELGNFVTIQPSTVLGSCGFGYSTDAKGEHTRISQIGKVVVEDHVEIGANTTVDRARFTETRIGQGTKVDSGVVIGHNVKVGRHNLICGQVGIAGSARTGNHVVIAGQVGIDGHLHIKDGAMISAKSGVTKSLDKGKYGGYPAEPLEDLNRNNVLIRNLKHTVAKVKELDERCKALEETND